MTSWSFFHLTDNEGVIPVHIHKNNHRILDFLSCDMLIIPSAQNTNQSEFSAIQTLQSFISKTFSQAIYSISGPID